MKNLKNVKNNIKIILDKEKIWFFIVLFIFFVAIFLGVVGFFLKENFPLFIFIKDSLSKLTELGVKTKNLNSFGRFYLIYKNNIIAMAFILFGGVFLGIFPIIGLLTNGLLLGFFLMILVFGKVSFFSKLITLVLLIPHGFIEIFLFIISASWGLKLGLEFLLPESKGKRFKVFLENLKSSFLVFYLLIFGLAIAAFFEVLDMKILEFLVR